MRLKLIFGLASAAVFLTSCYSRPEITVYNNIPNAVITDVYWGDAYVSGELLPGESAETGPIDKYTERVPATKRISFVMEAAGNRIFLETVAEYAVDRGEEVDIILDENTPVRNPVD